jgi:hypothetical protein
VTAIKIDPYMNIDAGTMAPTEHGEVFVLDDGGEVDLDLGNYERYLDVTLSRENNITTGIYKQVIEKEVSQTGAEKCWRKQNGQTDDFFNRGKETTLERLFRLCRISLQPFKTGSKRSPITR